MSLIIHSLKAAVSDKMKIDAHCHLTDARYESVKTVVFEAQNEGVNIMVDSGWNAKNSLLAKDNAQIFDGVYFTAGIHPSEANTFTAQDIEIVKSLLTHPKCLAVGEIGLDYHYDGYDAELQKKIFEEGFTTKKETEGSGLGLRIAKSSMNKMNGDLRLIKSDEKSTIFEIKMNKVEDGGVS